MRRYWTRPCGTPNPRPSAGSRSKAHEGRTTYNTRSPGGAGLNGAGPARVFSRSPCTYNYGHYSAAGRGLTGADGGRNAASDGAGGLSNPT